MARSTYLSHLPDSTNCKAKLNAIIDEYVPPEVLEQEHGVYPEEEEEAEVKSEEHNYYSNIPHSGLNTLQPVPTQILTLIDKIGNNLLIELDNGATVNYITKN